LAIIIVDIRVIISAIDVARYIVGCFGDISSKRLECKVDVKNDP
jgi:hypothetical protein